MNKLILSILLISLNGYLIADHTKDYNVIPCILKRFVRTPKSKIEEKQLASHPNIPTTRGMTESSTNWSGYVEATKLNEPKKKSVSYVSGTWNVPTILPSTNNTYSSVWVGIDGFTNHSVEQLGTEHDWINGKQVNYAWFEMYPDYAYEITNFPVTPGDSITANVHYKGQNVFVLSIANNTKKIKVTIPPKYTTSATAQRSCAEWIVEAPYQNKILPLAHFSSITFSNCESTINGINSSINIPRFQNTSINMVNHSGRLKAITTPLISDGKGFKVNWKSQ